jgi:hypothetical protein
MLAQSPALWMKNPAFVDNHGAFSATLEAAAARRVCGTARYFAVFPPRIT